MGDKSEQASIPPLQDPTPPKTTVGNLSHADTDTNSVLMCPCYPLNCDANTFNVVNITSCLPLVFFVSSMSNDPKKHMKNS
eukprot:3463333-Amphidinium_carterae.2